MSRQRRRLSRHQSWSAPTSLRLRQRRQHIPACSRSSTSSSLRRTASASSGVLSAMLREKEGHGAKLERHLLALPPFGLGATSCMSGEGGGGRRKVKTSSADVSAGSMCKILCVGPGRGGRPWLQIDPTAGSRNHHSQGTYRSP